MALSRALDCCVMPEPPLLSGCAALSPDVESPPERQEVEERQLPHEAAASPLEEAPDVTDSLNSGTGGARRPPERGSLKRHDTTIKHSSGRMHGNLARISKDGDGAVRPSEVSALRKTGQ